MKIYLDRSLEDIPLFKNLLTLLEGILSDKRYQKQSLTIEDIQGIVHLWDPVKDFIDYYELSSGSHYSNGQKQYMINALYASKGSQKVFDILKEVLDLNIEYTYKFPVVELMQFNEVVVVDIITFIEKLKNMLYYLIYYIDFNIRIINLILRINAELYEYQYKYNINYQIFEFK